MRLSGRTSVTAQGVERWAAFLGGELVAAGGEPDAPGEEALFRREKVHLDDDPERGGSRDVACPRVERIRFQYWDRRRGEWTREWSTRTTERANELPTRVRIKLELKVPGGEAEKLSTEARIALTRPLDTL